MYSLANHDLFKDSGCASYELKTSVVSLLAVFFLVLLFSVNSEIFSPFLVTIPILFNIFVSRHLLKLYYHTGGGKTALLASIYYMFAYSAVVGCGGLVGVISYFTKPQKQAILVPKRIHNIEIYRNEQYHI